MKTDNTGTDTGIKPLPPKNSEYTVEIGAPLLRPGLTIKMGPISEKYLVEETLKLLHATREINGYS